jgi:cysteinyl-tRNA synthetase
MKIFNTLSRTIDELIPLKDKTVKLYTCGLTVYSQPHIGNWVGYIYWDVLQRTLEHQGYTVERTQNITDVGHLTDDGDDGEDKMEKGAKREGLTAWDVADKFIKIADHEAYQLLGLKRPTHLVRATDYIPQQIAFVQDLESKGFTYVIPGDGVYFDTSKLDDYGKLARLDIDGLQAGARVPVEGKLNITDFALWKFSHAGVKRDMEWESPWGIGFPGWHLECSVIARETLGDQIDIHCGGIDHIPVHHTNEIAQTESVTGKQFSQVWMHNNHIKVNGTKMSKSLGNIYTLQDILDKGYDIQAFKILILSKHYQTEGNFTWEILDAAQNRLNNWKNIACLRWQTDSTDISGSIQKNSILELLSGGLDTPAAVAHIDEILTSFSKNYADTSNDSINTILNLIQELLGIDLILSTPDISDALKGQLLSRQEARDAKNWSESDKIRDELVKQNIAVLDTQAGQGWTFIKY